MTTTIVRTTLPADWEWASTQELCDWLGITRPQFYALRQSGDSPRGHRLGKQYRFRRRHVEEWLAKRAEP